MDISIISIVHYKTTARTKSFLLCVLKESIFLSVVVR